MAYVRVPPDGSGKKIYSKTHTVGADSVESQIVHICDPTIPTQVLHVDNKGSASIRFSEGEPTLGGFGQLKVNLERALGVYESSQGSYDDLFSIETASGGNSTYDDIAHNHIITTNTTNGSRVCRTTNRYHYYLPGSSNIVLMTIGCGDSGKANNIRRWGAFDDNDGFFFSLESTTLNVVLRSSTSGTVVETKIESANWNLDKLDGNGPSGYAINLSNINIYWVDYQWLGAGRVRFGVFAPDGSRIVCHVIENAGQNVLPYCRTGTLPIRTENLNTNTTASPTILREVCMAVYTEGNYEDYTFWRGADISVPNITVTGQETPLVFIRSKENVPNLNHFNSINTFLENISIYTDSPVKIKLYWDVTEIATGSWGITNEDSVIEASTDISCELNQAMHSFYTNIGSTNYDVSKIFEVNDEGILRKVDGTASIWAITATPLGSHTGAIVSLDVSYKEFW